MIKVDTFKGRKNVIFERGSIAGIDSKSSQQNNISPSCTALGETCDYEGHREEMLRDRLVVTLEYVTRNGQMGRPVLEKAKFVRQKR